MPSVTSPVWEAVYPEGWIAETTDESVTFYDRDSEVGTLQVSCLCKDEPVTEEDLLTLAEEIISAGKRHYPVAMGGMSGIMFRYYSGEEAWREWYLRSGHCMFFITYDCPREAEGIEDEEVAEVIQSIRLREE